MIKEYTLLRKKDLQWFSFLESKISLDKKFQVLFKLAKRLESKLEWSQVTIILPLEQLLKNVVWLMLMIKKVLLWKELILFKKLEVLSVKIAELLFVIVLEIKKQPNNRKKLLELTLFVTKKLLIKSILI